MEEIGSRMFSAGKDWVFASISSWFYWAIALVMHTLGWPGIIGIAAASLLLLSLSARAIRFIHSVKGMAATAGIALIAGGLTWWTWPAPASADPAPLLATSFRQATPAELAGITPPAAIEAVKAAEPPPVERLAARPVASLDLPAPPILALADPGVPEPMPLASAPAFPLAPIVVATPAAKAPHHESKPPPSPARRVQGGSAPIVSRPGNHGGFNFAGGHGGGFGGGHGFSPPVSHHRPTIHDLNNAAAHGYGPFAGPMMGMGGMGGMGGGVHPMHLGGGHPGMIHGGHVGHH